MVKQTHRRRVGFLSPHDPNDPDSQSGVPFQAARAIAKSIGDVHRFGPARPLIGYPLRLLRQISTRIAPGHAFHDGHSILAARARGRILTKRVRTARVDWIFAPYASGEVAFVETDIPIVYYSDTTFRGLVNYYPDFTNLRARTKRAGDELEARSIAKAALSVFSSRWAAESAVRDYGADPARVAVNELGANVDAPPARDLRFEPSTGKLRMLFMGVDWTRKGGPIASAATRLLRKQGIESELTVVGCQVPDRDRHAGVVEVGWLSRTDPVAREHLRSLMLASDLLFVPSRAECFGLVYVEAAAYALPSIATRTGGVPSAVVEGRSGFLVPLDSGAEEYARLIADLVGAPDRLIALRRTAREVYEERFTWESWGRRLAALTATLTPSSSTAK